MRTRVLDFVPAFLVDGGFYLLVFALTHVLDASGASSRDVALVFGLYTIIYALVAPLLGRATDHRGRRRSLRVGALLSCATALGLALAVDLTPTQAGLSIALRGDLLDPLGVRGTVYAAIVLFALANAFFWPAFQARIGDREADPEALGRAIRTFNVGWTSGKSLGFLAAGFLFASAPGACLFVGVATSLCVLVLVLLGEGDPAPPPAARPAVGPVTAVPLDEKRSFLLAALLANFTLWGTLATLKGLAPKLGTALGLAVEETGVLLFSALAAQMLGFLLLGRSARWRYRRGLLLLACPAACAGLALLGVAESLPLALLGAVGIGFAQAVTYTASVFYSLDFDERRGLRTGIHEAVLGFGGALPILGGLLADHSGWLKAPLVLMLGVGGLATGLMLVSLRARR